MPSALDVNLPADSAPARKSDLRANLVAAKRELEHGGYFKAPLVGTVERKVADKLGDRVSVKDFGAKGDDSTDDRAALQAAFNSGRQLYVPPGVYRVSAPIVYDVTKGFDIVGESANHHDPRRCTQIVGVFESSTGEPMIHPSSGYIDKNNAWVNGPDWANKGYLHPVSMRSIAVTANGTWGHCVQVHNLFNPSGFWNCAFASKFRGLLISQGFDIEVSNCRFAGTVFSAHDWQDEALMLKCFAFCMGAHGSIHSNSAVGYGVGFWINGYSVHAHALRAEVNYLGVRLGGGPSMGIDALGENYGVFSASTAQSIAVEANRVGMRVDNLDDCSRLSSVIAQGSPVGDGRPFESKSGIEIGAVSVYASIEGLKAGGDYTHYPILLTASPTPQLGFMEAAVGTALNPNPKAIAGVNGIFGVQGSNKHLFGVERLPVNFVRHAGLDWREHTITAFSDLQLRGLKGLDVYGANRQPNNFGKIETVASGATTKSIAFRDALGRPQIEVQPTAEAAAASTLAPGTYHYAMTFIRRGGEASAVIANPVTVAGTGIRVRLQPYGDNKADALRVYRGTAANRWDGCFEVPGWTTGPFFDSGQPFSGTRDWPPAGDGGVPSEYEPDVNYAVVVTPSWNTSCWVTGKATTGFMINFGTAAPAGATLQWLLFRP